MKTVTTLAALLTTLSSVPPHDVEAEKPAPLEIGAEPGPAVAARFEVEDWDATVAARHRTSRSSTSTVEK
jgi:hypothetical protein